MKYLFIVLSIFTLAISCSSPDERRADAQDRAREDYKEDMKQSEESYDQEVIEENKDEAREMIDDSDDVRSNTGSGRIQTED